MSSGRCMILQLAECVTDLRSAIQHHVTVRDNGKPKSALLLLSKSLVECKGRKS